VEKFVKNTVVFAVAAFFALMWGLLIRERILARQLEAPTALYDRVLKPGEAQRKSTFGIYFMGRRFGLTHSVVARLPDDSIRARSDTEIDVGPSLEPVIGVSGTIKVSFNAIIEPLSGLRHFTLTSEALGVRLYGLCREGELDIAGLLRGRKIRTSVPFNQRQFVTGMFSPLSGLPELDENAVGTTWRLHVVNPLLGGVDQVTAKVESSMRVPTGSGTARVFLITLNTSKSHWKTWVNADGEVLVQGTPIGLTLRREDIEPSIIRAILTREGAIPSQPASSPQTTD